MSYRSNMERFLIRSYQYVIARFDAHAKVDPGDLTEVAVRTGGSITST